MIELVELRYSEHRDIRINHGAAISHVASQHLINLQVTEVDKAISNFPVFFTRNSHTGQWAISAMASFTLGNNLFVVQGQWDAIYTPTSIQTYPLFLISSENSEKGYSVALDIRYQGITNREGEPLFESDGKASLHLLRITVMLESDVRNELLTRQFMKELSELGIIKPIDLNVLYKDGSVETIKGLHTADEDKLQTLGSEKLQELNSHGYLVPIYASLMSIYQLNGLIRRHNSFPSNKAIDKISLGIARPES